MLARILGWVRGATLSRSGGEYRFSVSAGPSQAMSRGTITSGERFASVFARVFEMSRISTRIRARISRVIAGVAPQNQCEKRAPRNQTRLVHRLHFASSEV